MTKTKNLGIWMDHSKAYLMEVKDDSIETNIIVSDFTHQKKEQSLRKSENLMHNQEQHQQSEYYKKIGEAIRNFDSIILFGPTNAKLELLNILNADQHFEKINIKTKQADKMTENQQHAFVRSYFSNL